MSDSNNIETLQQEILNLRAELDKIRNLAFALNDEAKELRRKSDEDDRTILRLESQYGVQYDRAEKLLNERDKARRDYCHYVAADRSGLDPSNPDFMAYCDKTSAPKVAEEMGWNCFKENK